MHQELSTAAELAGRRRDGASVGRRLQLEGTSGVAQLVRMPPGDAGVARYVRVEVEGGGEAMVVPSIDLGRGVS